MSEDDMIGMWYWFEELEEEEERKQKEDEKKKENKKFLEIKEELENVKKCR